MRLTFATTILLLPFLILLAACAGGAHQEQAILIQDAEKVALQVGELPSQFVAEGEPLHVTNEQSCATAPTDQERQECIDRLESFGRRDNYQVAYYSTDPAAMLSGVYYVFNGISVYDTVTGAERSFDDGQKRLDEAIREEQKVSRVPAPTVGDESAAFVVSQSDAGEAGSVPVSSYVVDFRRGNLLVRVSTDVATALGNVDEVVRLAGLVDERILRAAGRIVPTAPPTATP